MAESTCTVCSTTTIATDVCPECAALNFAGQTTPEPRWLRVVPEHGLPPTWWVEARLPLAPCRDGLRALPPAEEPAR